MSSTAFRKDLSISLPRADWLALRQEAARRRLSVAALCRSWLEPELQRIRDPQTTDSNLALTTSTR